MGYTHYWYRKLEYDSERYGKFFNKAKEIVEREFPDINLYRHFENDLIVLNGVGRQAHETFDFPRVFGKEFLQPHNKNPNLFFDCTKTAFKPYDIVVVTLLALAKQIFGEDIVLDSDGGKDVFDQGDKILKAFM